MSQTLVFRLGEENYALEVGLIQEVVEAAELHFIPRAPGIFLGAINFHGTVLPVLDLVSYLGFTGAERDSRIVALATETCSMALAVSEVQRIVVLDPETLMPCPEEKKTARFVRGVSGTDSTLVNLLNLHELLKDLEIQLAATGGRHGA